MIPQYIPFTPGTAGVQSELLQLRLQRRLSRGGRTWRPACSAPLLGDPQQATIRAGYSMTYNVERFDRFTANAGANPGGTTVASRNTGTGYCIVCAGESWPLLFREKSRLGAPAFPDAPVYPITGTSANSLNMFNPDLRTPRVHSMSVGFQRSIGKDMAAEVRYVGNRNKFAWAEENWNERVVFENGFFDEWKLASANLKANLAGGKGATFAYTGIPGTSPLPIHQAYLSGKGALDTYTATQYTNTAFLARFSDLEPDPLGAAGALDTAAFRTLAQGIGYPDQLLGDEPELGRHVRREGQRGFEVRQPADRAAPPPLAGPARQRQLHLRHLVHHEQPEPAFRSALRGEHGRAARVEDELGLRDAGRPRQAVRHGHEQVSSTASSATGSSRATRASRSRRSASRTRSWSA